MSATQEPASPAMRCLGAKASPCLFIFSNIAGEPETCVIIPAITFVAVPRCSSEQRRFIPPRSSAPDANLGVTADPNAAIRWRPFIRLMPGISAPLTNVAMHLIEAPSVWRKFLNRHRSTAKAAGYARKTHLGVKIGHRVGDRVAPREPGFRAGATAIFPFGFGQESIRVPSFVAKPGQSKEQKMYCLLSSDLRSQLSSLPCRGTFSDDDEWCPVGRMLLVLRAIVDDGQHGPAQCL